MEKLRHRGLQQQSQLQGGPAKRVGEGSLCEPSHTQHQGMKMPRTPPIGASLGLTPPQTGAPGLPQGCSRTHGHCWPRWFVPTLCGVMVLPEDFGKLLVAELLGMEDDPHHLSMPRQPCGATGAAPHRGLLPPNLPLPWDGRDRRPMHPPAGS